MDAFDISSMIEEQTAVGCQSTSDDKQANSVGQSTKIEGSGQSTPTGNDVQAGGAGQSTPPTTDATSTEPEEMAVPKFWNQDARKPQYEIKVERPEHRAICILAAQGLTSTEIAEQTGYTTACIQNVRKQEWAQSYIAHLMEKTGRKAVMSELQGAAKEAAELIIKSIRGELMDQKPADRCKDAHKLLDRLYGTAPQIVMHGNVDAAELSDEELAATIASGNSQ